MTLMIFRSSLVKYKWMSKTTLPKKKPKNQKNKNKNKIKKKTYFTNQSNIQITWTKMFSQYLFLSISLISVPVLISVKRSESGLSAIYFRNLFPQFSSAICMHHFSQCNVFCSKQKQKYIVLNFMFYVFS